jgi:tryptophan halogenase
MNHKFTIVGGGTAGLVSALILKKRLNCDVKIIRSEKIGIIGVGEGSTEHWGQFMEAVDINYQDLIKEAGCTIKLGVYFDSWTKNPYFHNITEFSQIQAGQHQSGVASMYINDRPQKEITDYHVLDNLIEDIDGRSPSRQYHFNTVKLNQYLTRLCKERDINIFEDEIVDVKVDSVGITEIQGQKTTYYSDFWIDCTGFSRTLISKLDAVWNSYEQHLKLNHAIAFQTEDTNEYTPYTLAKAMKYGWLWRIPVQGRWGNGYIFDDKYIDSNEAKKEVEELYGHEITVGKDIKFNPGALKDPWIKNCMAVGLSANFVEPLEATSIGTSINQMFLFLHYWIPNYHNDDIKEFNYKMECIMNNVRDFVYLHYLVDRNDTTFWKDLKDTNYCLFKEHNFASVLYGIEFYDKQQVKIEFEKFSEEVRDEIERSVKNHSFYYKVRKDNYTPHKEWLINLQKDVN